MKLYLNVASNRIIGIDTEKINEDDIEVETSTIEQLEEIANDKSLEIDESIEQELEALFDNEKIEDDKFTIKHWVSNRSIGELIDMYDSGEIVKPTMQRNLVE